MQKGLSKISYLWITLILVVPFTCFAYFEASTQQEMLYQKEEKRLLEIAGMIEQALPRGIEDALREQAESGRSEDEQVKQLNQLIQPGLAQAVAGFDVKTAGFYARVLGRVLAVSPNFQERYLVRRDYSSYMHTCLTGKVEVIFRRGSFDGSMKETMIVSYPVYRNGKLLGHTWSSSHTDNIRQAFYVTMARTLGSATVIWLLVLASVGWTVKRLIARQSQELEQLMDSTPVMFLSVDKNGMIMSINGLCLEYFSFNKSQVLGKHFSILTNTHNRISTDAFILRSLHGKEVRNEIFTSMGRQLLVSAYPLIEKKQVKGAIAIGQDITEVTALRKEMNDMERLRLIGKMCGSLAHEIRNPLTVIRGFIQLMKERSDEPHYPIILDELDRTNEIISDFLSLAQNRIVEKQAFNLNDIILKIYPLLQADANLRGLHIELDLDKRLPELLMSDKEIKQLLLNLARNGMEAMETGTLRISTRMRAPYVELHIADEGCGMDEQLREKLFEPFFTTKHNGTGLGLPACKSIVEQHNGTITLETKVGTGTTFIVSFRQSAEAAS